jgi:hypothetical protein
MNFPPDNASRPRRRQDVSRHAAHKVAGAVIVIVSGCFGWGDTFAQARKPGKDRKEALAELSKLAASFEVRLEKDRVATREAEPAMRWTNTIGHATDAALFFWMHNGRPVAVGTTFVTDNVVVGQEFQSLSLEPLEARRKGKSVWTPREAGVEFRRIPDAPAPAETARQRLSQMKTLARRFRAEATKSPPAYQENDVRELRLLTQPVLQYQDPVTEEHEGAVFAFAMDTDADVLLLIESRIRDGKASWEFALARTNPFVLKVWCDDDLVWSQKRADTANDPSLPYIIVGPFPLKDE